MSCSQQRTDDDWARSEQSRRDDASSRQDRAETDRAEQAFGRNAASDWGGPGIHASRDQRATRRRGVVCCTAKRRKDSESSGVAWRGHPRSRPGLRRPCVPGVAFAGAQPARRGGRRCIRRRALRSSAVGRREEPRFVHPSQSFSSIASSGRIASESSIAPDIRAAANSMTTFSLNKSGRAAE